MAGVCPPGSARGRPRLPGDTVSRVGDAVCCPALLLEDRQPGLCVCPEGLAGSRASRGVCVSLLNTSWQHRGAAGNAALGGWRSVTARAGCPAPSCPASVGPWLSGALGVRLLEKGGSSQFWYRAAVPGIPVLLLLLLELPRNFQHPSPRQLTVGMDRPPERTGAQNHQ